MTYSSNVIDLHLIKTDHEFFSQRTLVGGLILASFGSGLIMRQVSLNDPKPTLIALGLMFLAFTSFLILLIVRRCRVSVTNEHLVVKTSNGTQRFPLENLRRQGLRTLNLSGYCSLGTSASTWQTMISSTKTVSHPLLNGERAIVVITDPSRVCRLRSYDDGVTLLLSLQDPETLRSLLNRKADSSPPAVSRIELPERR